MADFDKVVGVIRDESGAITKFVVENEDHSLSELDGPVPESPTTLPIVDQAYKAYTDAGAAVALDYGTPEFIGGLIDYVDSTADFVSRNGNGSLAIDPGLYLFQLRLQKDSSNGTRGLVTINPGDGGSINDLSPLQVSGSADADHSVAMQMVVPVLSPIASLFVFGWLDVSPITYGELRIAKLADVS